MAKKKTKREAVNDGVKAAIRGDIKEPLVAELVSEFVRIAGGVRGVAKLMFDTFQATKSDMQKHRILQLITYGMRFANMQSGPRDDLGLATEADLEKLAGSLLEKLQTAHAKQGKKAEADG